MTSSRATRRNRRTATEVAPPRNGLSTAGVPSTVGALPPLAPSGLAKDLALLACVAGIYTCYLSYGVLQERIYKSSYAPAATDLIDGGRYHFTLFLVFAQTTVNALSALPPLASFAQPKHTVPVWKYAKLALFYLAAMLFSFSALHHMSYPMQALGKSCKMVPVMLMGVLIRGRKYTPRDYACAFLITAGVAIFSYKGSAANAQSHTSALGVFLLLASLVMDARDVATFAAVSAVGQHFIFYTIRNFSALACTTITTTRKFFTILASVVYYKHSLLPRQWSAVGLVFGAIVWEGVAKHQKKREAAAAFAAKASAQDPRSASTVGEKKET
ncbi:hypothetical protein I4F81_006689 [Pyropia yezoensis]|uniref:Uncharacterized protein n=1 Tax=Pyropia yezoensis TaxID=2788 RepID=A0ACC3C2Y4_PYRYE|nr:hypothetical protein I4F81_006689 [Neopyropia yezoensis]